MENILFGKTTLRPQIAVTQSTVECPVNGCSHIVPRQRKTFTRNEEFYCPTHDIYISPSTFEYSTEAANLLWNAGPDRELWKGIKKFKRESRVARDNSEDALTWNIFRFLQSTDLLHKWLGTIQNMESKIDDVIYWSYSCRAQSEWSLLVDARGDFGEENRRGSEPDLIVETESTVYFVEAKLTAMNKTKPSSQSPKKYLVGGGNWFNTVFTHDYDTIAVVKEKYELMRFWLLGSWIARRLKKNFILISLVTDVRDRAIESEFKPLIREAQSTAQGRVFCRTTWESIYKFLGGLPPTNGTRMVRAYMENKTVGYRDGNLQSAFDLS